MSASGGRLELREVGEDGLTECERIVRDLRATYDGLAFLVAEWCPFCGKSGPAWPHEHSCVIRRSMETGLPS